ncbi:hypothetical protein TCAL_00731 [Tigriopus californicus]|uniref:Sodium/hydrogen exchanger n=1 Tax=Tigriopus californicus TaxID=6832 RepID=A0A553PAQ2_TIGCA|nr:sodium/hydrogen exchanger 6-like [Tigriopus californicus]TRY74763.1 hypothetical protein TCAL_00731 [Tigriopus californicus]
MDQVPRFVLEEKIPPELMIDEKEAQIHRLDSLSLLLYMCLLALTVLTIWCFKHRRIRYVHETGLAVIYGLVIGAVIRYAITSEDVTSMRVKPAHRSDLTNGTRYGPPDFLLLSVQDIPSKRARQKLLNRTLAYSFKGEVKDISRVNEVDQKTTFDPEIFLNVILPPIIFHAGYSMKRRFFFRNIGSILVFAFVGTTISTFVVGGIVYGVTQIFPHLAHTFSLLDALHFGAMISATDPVTVLAIFNDLHVDVNLYALVFGESVLNDAVAIVMSRTLEDYEENLKTGQAMTTSIVLLKSVGEFLGIFFASFLVGGIMGCLTAVLTKFTHIRQFPELESTLFVIMSYSSFLLAEVLNLTGIVAVLFCGICQAHYTYNNLSNESRTITKEFFNLLNFMAENFIFSYIGVSMFTFPKHHFDAPFICGSFVAILVGRALNIYPLAFLLNLGRQTKITMNIQHMMVLSGLRGAIAFSLAIRNTLTEARQLILTTTLIIVIITVIVCGGSTMSVLTRLGIPLGVNDDENMPLGSPQAHQYNNVEEGDNPLDRSHMGSHPNAPGSRPKKSILAKVWGGFDSKFMKPLLTHSNPTLMETLPMCCLPLARLLTSVEQLSRHPAMQISDDDRASASGAEFSRQNSSDEQAETHPPTVISNPALAKSAAKVRAQPLPSSHI